MSESIHNSTYKYHKQNIILRREKVLELAATGKTQEAIAEELGVHQSLISLDLQAIKCQAASQIKLWVDELIPLEFNKTIAGYNLIIKTAWQPAQDNDVDVRDRLSALSLLSSAYNDKMNMITNSTIIDNAVRKIENMKRQIENIRENNQDASSSVDYGVDNSNNNNNSNDETEEDPQAKFDYVCDDSDPQMLGHYDSKLGHIVYEPWEYELRDRLKKGQVEYKKWKEEQGKTNRDYGGNRQF
jgi:hypothetical protein